MKHLSEIFDYLKEGMSGPDFYNQLTSPDFKSNDTFRVKIPFTFGEKKVDVQIPIKLEMGNLEKEVEQYLTAPPELKTKFDTYAYWYDNFNKLIFDSMPENDACLFLAACAYCSANTALGQNISEAAKLFTTVKQDMTIPNGKQMLADLANNVTDNISLKNLTYIKSYADKGSKYAAVLMPKEDREDPTNTKGVSEIVVSNAKLPNFNLFVKYYLSHDGNITRDQLYNDVKNGKLKIGGTKINSFFLNLIFPGYKWDGELDPATIDRWMIRVFFDKPLEKMVEEDVTDWIEYMSNQKAIKSGKNDTETSLNKKKSANFQKSKDAVVNAAIMQLFGNDVVRQNLIKLLHEAGKRMGLSSYQLQALAWVNIRIRYDIPAGKFAKFEDVMDFAENAAKEITNIDPDINSVMRTIKILVSKPRFKFSDKPESTDTVADSSSYEKVYFLPSKNDVEKKAKKKIVMADARWTKIKVALKDDTHVDVYDLSVSNKKPVKQLQGTDRRNVLHKSLRWLLSYNPEINKPVSPSS